MRWRARNWPGRYISRSSSLSATASCKEWPDGRPLPNETDLARTYGVSVGTMRKALDLLAQSKLIVRRQGLGTFVNSQREDPPSRFRRWIIDGQLVAETGHDVIEKSFAQPTLADARLLRIGDKAPVARITVKTTVAGHATCLDHYVIAVAQAPGLDDFMTDTGPSFTPHLEKLEAGITRCEDRLKPELASAETARRLGVDIAAPVLRIDRLALGRDAHPLYVCCRLIVATEAGYQVGVEYKRPARHCLMNCRAVHHQSWSKGVNHNCARLATA
jgi:GntR family transcriptional regulator